MCEIEDMAQKDGVTAADAGDAAAETPGAASGVAAEVGSRAMWVDLGLDQRLEHSICAALRAPAACLAGQHGRGQC